MACASQLLLYVEFQNHGLENVKRITESRQYMGLCPIRDVFSGKPIKPQDPSLARALSKALGSPGSVFTKLCFSKICRRNIHWMQSITVTVSFHSFLSSSRLCLGLGGDGVWEGTASAIQESWAGHKFSLGLTAILMWPIQSYNLV